MRFLRLDLLRYGPFTDRILEFRPDAKLHLVYGPNEAGKSSSLAAIGDLLFGFPKRKEYDFLHDAQTLRVGAEIASRSGETLGFRRRRGNKRTLLGLDEVETPLHEDALAPFLGNLSRDVFARAFGLNSDSLRQGGEAMLESEGEMGAALFAAASGLTGLARIRKTLDAEAEAIFAPRNSRERSFYQALDRYDLAAATERRHALKSDDWKALIGEIADIERQLSTIRTERAETTAALARLQRLKVLEPIVLSMDRVGGELKELADLPEAPHGFLLECAAALDAAEGASGEERASAEEEAAVRAALESIVVETRTLARAREITEVFSRKGDYLSKLTDCPRIEYERDRFSAALTSLAQRLGLSSPDEMARRLPTDAQIEGARALIEEGLALETSIATDEKRLADEITAQIVEDAAAGSEGLTDPKPWRDQLAALGPDLKELEEQASLETSLRALQQKLRDGLQKLVPPAGDLESIAAAPLPSREAIAAHKATFDRLMGQQRDETVKLDSNAEQRREALQKLAEIEQSGPVAYEETIRLVRADRDASYALLRAQLMRQGKLMSQAELGARLAQFEEESAEADSLADLAIADADRLSRRAAHQDKIAELDRQRPLIETRLAELDAERSQAQAAYEGLFAPIGLAPASPDEMMAWLISVEDLLALRREAEMLGGRIEGLAGLATQTHGALSAIANRIGVAGAETLPALALSRLIGATLEEMTNLWAARRTLEGARQAARIRIGQMEDGLAKARRRLEEWRQKFDAVLPDIGLAAGTTPVAASAALEVWRAVPDIIRERDNREARAAAMRHDMAGFEEAVLLLARDLTPVITDLPVQGLIDVLRERAETARAAKVRHDDARARLELAQKRHAAARAAREAATTALDALAVLLPESSDPRTGLQRLERRDQLRAELATRRREFEQHAEGTSEASVRADLPGFDRDRAVLDAEDLERRQDALGSENDSLHALLGQKQAQREVLEAGTGAEFAAFERRSAEAEIVATARQWAVRKIAATMLGAAIERHREAQSDPLMLRAGALFSTLTSGSFASLMQDYGEEDDQTRLVGVRASGERVAIAGMSEGTRDQLYLALRLAYIEDYADRTEPVPFIGDDLFQTFDDERTRAGILAFASTSPVFQPILFTHHMSVVATAREALGEELDYIEL
ncbi:MAG TPA: AAA family ATPase [Devosiaceae bacterium]|nr:AAA family ATPase [Devosiaceae bacterium]